MMNRDRVSQIIGTIGLTLTAIGAALYAIDSPLIMVTRVALFGGSLVFIVYVLMNIGGLREFFGKRSSRHGANMVVVIILFTSIAVIVQAISARHSRRYDLTRNKRFTLAQQTLNVIHSLEDNLRIFAFFKPGPDETLRVEDLVSQYAHHSDMIRYEFIDPDQKPMIVKEMGVTSYGTLVLQYGNTNAILTNVTEESLTNAILKVTRDAPKVIYFVTGHGEKKTDNQEPFGYSVLKNAIEKENYVARTLSVFDSERIPDDANLLIIAGPKHDYFEAEMEKIEDYLFAGRNAIFLLDPQVDLPNLELLLAQYRIRLGNDVIIDPYSRIFGGEYTVPVVTEYEKHAITAGFDMASFYPMARSVRISEEEIPGVRAQHLAIAGKSAWGETDLDGVRRGQAARDDVDALPPVSVASVSAKRFESGEASADGPDESTIVVFGDSEFVDNSSFRISGNADLFLNVINFLAEEKDLIAIRPKAGLGDRLFLTASQGRLIFLVAVVVIPLAVMTFGVAVFTRRRKLG